MTHIPLYDKKSLKLMATEKTFNLSSFVKMEVDQVRLVAHPKIYSFCGRKEYISQGHSCFYPNPFYLDEGTLLKIVSITHSYSACKIFFKEGIGLRTNDRDLDELYFIKTSVLANCPVFADVEEWFEKRILHQKGFLRLADERVDVFNRPDEYDDFASMYYLDQFLTETTDVIKSYENYDRFYREHILNDFQLVNWDNHLEVFNELCFINEAMHWLIVNEIEEHDFWTEKFPRHFAALKECYIRFLELAKKAGIDLV